MRLFFILLIALFSSHAYSFSLDLETITDTLEQVSEELSENAKKEETQAQDEEEKRLAKEKKLADDKAAKEKKLADDKAAKEKRLADDKAAKDKLEKNLSLLPSQTDLEKAQNFLINIKSFIKVYPDEFDIVKISEFLISTKPISEGKLDDVLKSNLKLFQEFTNKSNEFVKFYETNELERKNKAIEKIDQVKLSLEQNIKTLKEFLINNPDSIYTEQWVEDMKKANDILNNASNYDELVNENKRLTNVIANNEKINKVKIDAKLTVVELKEKLKLNLTSDLAPLIIEKVKSLEQAIKKENIEDITLADKNAKEFIFKQFEEPKLKAKEKKLADAKAAKEKKLAEAKAAKEKKLADAKAAKEKKLADEKAAKEKKLADEKAAKEKKLAEAKALEEYKKSPEGIKKEKERVKKEKEKTARLKKEKKESINKLTVTDVIVEEAEIIGQEVMVPGWMTYYADDLCMLFEYAGTMTALSVNTDNLNKKQKKWIVSKCGSGCYVNLTGVVKKDQIIMATEIEKMSFKDKMINISIGEKNLLLN